MQLAMRLTWTLAERSASFRFLIRDRDQKFTASFDDVFLGSGLRLFARHFARPRRTASRSGSCAPFGQNLDWPLILNHPHLKRILDVFVEHCNGHWPHRALGFTPPRLARPAVAMACGETVFSVAIVSAV